VRRGRSRGTGRLSPLTRERGSGRLCGLRNGEQHVDKLAQRTAGADRLSATGGERRTRESCAEDGASGGCWRGAFGFRGQESRRLAQQQQSQPESAWPSHASPGRRGPPGQADQRRFYGIMWARQRAPTRKRHLTRKRHRALRCPLVESLILAQDQRWRRA
jgi:hypothetical protein